jgi:peroxiredoxin
MSLLESKNISLGTKLPKFSLENPYGKKYNMYDEIGQNGLLVIITCNHCPYAQAVWGRVKEVAEFADKLGVNTVAINPNLHPNYPEDSISKMKEKIEDEQLNFPYLVDKTQEFSKALQAVCTPDIYLFDREGKLYYHGRVDDNWQDAKKVKKEELKDALMLLFTDKKPPKIQYPSMGCSIKWLNTVVG